jgi:hypothetical protein
MDLNQWPKDLPATEGRTNVIEVIPGVKECPHNAVD